MAEPVLPVEYRADVLQEIIPLLRSGESCSVIGIAGAGKGNLARHLLRADVRQHYFAAEMTQLVVAYLSCTSLAQRPLHVIYLNALDNLTQALTEPGGAFTPLVPELKELWKEAQANPELLAKRNLDQALTQTQRAGAQQVILILDDCDELFAKAPRVLFADLRELRDNHKYRLVYLILTRRELQFLRSDYTEEEELADILSARQLISVPPHSYVDSFAMLKRLAARHNPPYPITDVEIKQLYEWGGGHASLMRALFFATHYKIAWQSPDAFSQLAHDPDIEAECQKIWDGLEPEERADLSRLVHAQLPEPAALRRLEKRGLIRTHPRRAPEFCSPLFEMFVPSMAGLPGAAGRLTLEFTGAPPQVQVNGQALTNLSLPEYELLRCLWAKRGQTSSNNDLLAVMWLAEVNEPMSKTVGHPLQRLEFYMLELKAKLGPVGQAIHKENDGYRLVP